MRVGDSERHTRTAMDRENDDRDGGKKDGEETKAATV